MADRLVGDELSRRLMKGGLAALVIKVGSAGLSFLMLLVLARAMSADDFGRFGFGFSLATLLAAVGSLGQRTLVLRFAPVYDHDGATAKLTGVVRDGYRLVALGCGLCATATVLVALILPGLEPRGYLVAAGLFALMLGFAEYQAHVLRAVGGMVLALAPNDILWRASVVVAALGSAAGVMPMLDAAGGLFLIGGILAAILVGQAFAHPVTRPTTLLTRPADMSDRPSWRQAMWGLWASGVVTMAAPNLAVVVLGLILSPEQTGPFFAALRVSMLLNLFLIASNMIAAPMISRSHHRGGEGELQRLCTRIVIGLALPTGVLFALILLAGDHVLALFGEGYGSAYWPLVLLSAGYLVNALSGSSSQLLQMTGDERHFLRIVTIVNGVSIAALAPLGLALGPIGAALALTFSQSAWNVACVVRAKARLKVDPSILSLAARPK
ncbi:lipopolysaccharide biosynthesis protein [Chthonobacter rhizosphaerae]|uniref:lipopolysaccharide biosynthesis protein n=1 Tax=Chthonobacter rhizosphaerae TaxID=2735553 RepID=UPI001AED4D79|nr:oligosaccharide flippase family protein [Chthonobacter rhizosphaerae]